MTGRGTDAGSTLTSTTIDPSSLPASAARKLVPALTIACHPDLARVGERALLSELLDARRTNLSRTEPEFETTQRHGSGGGPLRDPHIGRDPILIAIDPAGIRIDCRASSTRVQVDGELVSPATWLGSDQLERGVCIELANRIVLVLHLADASPAPLDDHGLVGRAECMRILRDEIERAATHAAPVLIVGESGSGKELVAGAIHRASKRAAGPFECVNVAAIPPTTAAAELFGHARGAFTGAASAHGGWFGRAHGGSLFLDEIGEAPEAVQPMLLRSIELGEVQPVGAQGLRKVDVRVLAATDANLANAVASGRFRFPLLQRLAGHTIAVPPLRQRKSDIGALLVHFIERELAMHGGALPNDSSAPWLPAPIVARALRHDWPGNVRELNNFARELVLGSVAQPQARIGRVFDALLPPADRGRATDAFDRVSHTASRPDAGERQPIDDERLITTLRAQRWRVAATARALGISKNTLYQLMERCSGIRKARDLSADEIGACRDACGGDIAKMAERLEVSERGLKLRMTELGIG